MITIKLQGGLGNQMFQYAAARSLALRNHTVPTLDLSWFGQDFDDSTTPRHYELSCFVLDSSTSRYKGTVLEKLQRRFAMQYKEPHFHFDKAFKALPKNTTLEGYFQSEKYFSDIRDELLSDFSWVKEAKGTNRELLGRIKKDESSVSVHVRRGDYVSNENAAKFHGLTGLEYYNAAYQRIKKQIKKPRLYIFSDEPDWCKKSLKFDAPTIYVSHNSDGSEDMRLMKACQHNIIANSSFSWWAAWLNENPDKIVIAPKQWFSHSESNTKDIIPPSWHKL
ncbi:alpha-1,2-fucosyltransferase [bacterium]|nr:alpha-1,2-fucosyltransferase [bacterium]